MFFKTILFILTHLSGACQKIIQLRFDPQTLQNTKHTIQTGYLKPDKHGRAVSQEETRGGREDLPAGWWVELREDMLKREVKGKS